MPILLQESYWDNVENSEATVYLTPQLRIRLTDPHRIPIKNGKCRIADEPHTIYKCDDKGVVVIPFKNIDKTTIELEWELEDASKNETGERFYWRAPLQLGTNYQDDSDDLRFEKCLINLGFVGGSFNERVEAYQRYCDQVVDGNLTKDQKRDLLAWHGGGLWPLMGAAVLGQTSGSGASAGHPPKDEGGISARMKLLTSVGGIKATYVQLRERMFGKHLVREYIDTKKIVYFENVDAVMDHAWKISTEDSAFPREVGVFFTEKNHTLEARIFLGPINGGSVKMPIGKRFYSEGYHDCWGNAVAMTHTHYFKYGTVVNPLTSNAGVTSDPRLISGADINLAKSYRGYSRSRNLEAFVMTWGVNGEDPSGKGIYLHF